MIKWVLGLRVHSTKTRRRVRIASDQNPKSPVIYLCKLDYHATTLRGLWSSSFCFFFFINFVTLVSWKFSQSWTIDKNVVKGLPRINFSRFSAVGKAFVICLESSLSSVRTIYDSSLCCMVATARPVDRERLPKCIDWLDSEEALI